jgi:hypothetical protein
MFTSAGFVNNFHLDVYSKGNLNKFYPVAEKGKLVSCWLYRLHPGVQY